MPLKTVYHDEGPSGWRAGDYDVTRRDIGRLSPRKLLRFVGQKGEQQLFENSQTGRYSLREWRHFVADIRRRGVQSAISVLVLKNGDVVIQEGNHRIRAAIAAGRRSVPVEVSYYGNSQRLHTLRFGTSRSRR